MVNKEEILKEIREKYTFEVLKHRDVEKIKETADVITDTFLGVKIGSAFIRLGLQVQLCGLSLTSQNLYHQPVYCLCKQGLRRNLFCHQNRINQTYLI